MHTMIQEVRLVCSDGWPEVSLDVTLLPPPGSPWHVGSTKHLSSLPIFKLATPAEQFHPILSLKILTITL